MLKDLYGYQRQGLWLAVITKNQKLKVVASSKDPKKALEKAHQEGFRKASLMMSSSRYASWAPYGI